MSNKQTLPPPPKKQEHEDEDDEEDSFGPAAKTPSSGGTTTATPAKKPTLKEGEFEGSVFNNVKKAQSSTDTKDDDKDDSEWADTGAPYDDYPTKPVHVSSDTGGVVDDDEEDQKIGDKNSTDD